MIGRRKTNLDLGMARLYAYKGKRTTTYYTITPDNRRINLGHDLREAKRKLLEIDGESVPTGTLATHLDDLLTERRKKVAAGKLSANTIETNDAEIEQLKKAFGKMQPEDLKPSHVWSYMHKFRGAESPVRANREIALLSTLYNRLMGAGVVDRNPCVGVERNEETPRDRLVSDAELRNFCRFARGRSDAGKRVALATMIAYLTGKAQAQVLKLHRSQINDKGILFSKRKRGAATLVEWTKRLRIYIKASQEMPCDITPMFVIHSQAGTPYTSSGFKSIWQRLMNEWVKAENERFTFHDLRAKAVTDVEEQGRDASDLTGHRQQATVENVYDRRRVRKALAVK